MRVGLGDGRDAETEELLLRVERQHRRRAGAVALDAPRRGEHRDRALERRVVEPVAHAAQRVCEVGNYLDSGAGVLTS